MRPSPPTPPPRQPLSSTDARAARIATWRSLIEIATQQEERTMYPNTTHEELIQEGQRHEIDSGQASPIPFSIFNCAARSPADRRQRKIAIRDLDIDLGYAQHARIMQAEIDALPPNP